MAFRAVFGKKGCYCAEIQKICTNEKVRLAQKTPPYFFMEGLFYRYFSDKDEKNSWFCVPTTVLTLYDFYAIYCSNVDSKLCICEKVVYSWFN